MIPFFSAQVNNTKVKRNNFKMIFTRSLIISMILVISFAKFINCDESDETVANVAVKPDMKKFTDAERSTAENVDKDLQKIKQQSQASSGIVNLVLQSMKILTWPLKLVWNNNGTDDTKIVTSSKTRENQKT